MKCTRSNKSEGVATPLLAFLLLVLLPSHIYPGVGEQFFVDMTEEYLPPIIDHSSDADFGDVDLDGYLDLFISNGDEPYLPNYLLINAQGDSFIDQSEERLPNRFVIGTPAADFGDVDGDGSLDIIVGNWDADNQLLMNNGLGFFTDGEGMLPSDLERDCKGIKIGDVDNDLDLDIIAVNFNSARNLLYINDGAGTFAIARESQFPSGSEHSNHLGLGDVDGDFDLDVVIANNTGAPNQLMINDGMGFFNDESELRLPGDLSQSNGIEFGDVDGDGDIDIAVANGFFARNRMLINDGSGHFKDESSKRLPIDFVSQWRNRFW